MEIRTAFFNPILLYFNYLKYYDLNDYILL